MYLPFDAKERAGILQEYHSIIPRWERLDYDVGLGRADPAMEAEYSALSRRLTDCTDRYRDQVPLVPVSRCPFSGEVVYHSLDPLGIDGLWWRYRTPIRPLEMLPGTFAGLSGALAIRGAPEPVPFEVRPGPGVPFLIPRIMKDPGMKAVISSVRIGNHTGYPVCYFTPDLGQGIPRCNTWGTDRWIHLDHDGVLQWDEVEEDEGVFDYELEPWIRNGRVLWIAEGDSTLTLRQGGGDCPYLGLAGSKTPARIRDGRIMQGGE